MLGPDSPSQDKQRSRHQFTSSSSGSSSPPLHGKPESSCFGDDLSSNSVTVRSRSSLLSAADGGGSTNKGVSLKNDCSKLS